MIGATMAAAEQAPLAPHPRDLPIIGSMAAFARDTLGAVMSGWRECGDVVRFRGLRPMTLAAHPDEVRLVLEERMDIYPRSDVVQTGLAPLLGSGVFTVGPDRWPQQRRLVAPAFHGERIELVGERIAATTSALLERWEAHDTDQPLDVREEMTGLSLELAEQMVLGRSDERFRAAFTTATEYLIPRIMSPVNPPPFAPAAWRARAATRFVHEEVLREIASRRTNGGDDLLALLVEARDAETGETLSDDGVRDEALTALFGAYKGIPQGLMWTWYLLGESPDEWTRVHEEALAVVGGRQAETNDLAGLRRTRMAIEEALRLYPPLWIWSRQATEDNLIRGYRVRKGEFAICIPYVTHRHPEFWERPEDFDPDRFAPERVAERPPFAYFPFGAGPRVCVAEGLSLNAMQLVVATMIQRVRLRVAPGFTLNRDLEFLLRPAKGMPMTVELLAPSPAATASPS
jgi:cytochrome P450